MSLYLALVCLVCLAVAVVRGDDDYEALLLKDPSKCKDRPDAPAADEIVANYDFRKEGGGHSRLGKRKSRKYGVYFMGGPRLDGLSGAHEKHHHIAEEEARRKVNDHIALLRAKRTARLAVHDRVCASLATKALEEKAAQSRQELQEATARGVAEALARHSTPDIQSSTADARTSNKLLSDIHGTETHAESVLLTY